MHKLKVDSQIHQKLGMRILTNNDVAKLERHVQFMEYPKDIPFNPKGISLEEAQEIMRKIDENRTQR